MPRRCRKIRALPQGRERTAGAPSLGRRVQSQAALSEPCAPLLPQKISAGHPGMVRRGQKSLFLQKKSCFFEKKPLQRAFSYYIILLLRSAQYGMRQKVAGGHFRVISADNRPTIGRSKGQMPEKRGAFALKNSYGTHGSVCKGGNDAGPCSGPNTTCGGKARKSRKKCHIGKGGIISNGKPKNQN